MWKGENIIFFYHTPHISIYLNVAGKNIRNNWTPARHISHTCFSLYNPLTLSLDFTPEINDGDSNRHNGRISDENQSVRAVNVDGRRRSLSVPVQAPKVPLFESLKQRKVNAWIISLFVFLRIVGLATTMFINNCWHNSQRSFVSFQRLDENPLLGPSASTWVDKL